MIRARLSLTAARAFLIGLWFGLWAAFASRF